MAVLPLLARELRRASDLPSSSLGFRAQEALGFRAQEALAPSAPFVAQIPEGKLIEISGAGASARISLALALVAHAQSRGEPAAWIQPASRTVYPPDVVEAGIDLDALVVVHIPISGAVHDLARAAELLLRTGGFGAVVIDCTEHAPTQAAWASRLSGLAREHRALLVVLTRKSMAHGSLGPLVAVRVEARRNGFEIEPVVMKNKAGVPLAPSAIAIRAPPGLEPPPPEAPREIEASQERGSS